ncbi:geranylgeranyl pyrophosphate synthase [Streptomyces longisporoflavus]|nr:geranylgeranyl pyrophosphate synthase [Streptomyces longisporoflavus]
MPLSAPTAADDQVERLLRTAAGRTVARHLGQAVVRADLSGTLRAIGTALDASPLVTPPALTDVLTGGKRLRPLLVIAASRTAGAPPPRLSERVVQAATAVELLHLASLVHDDLMDQAATRHGVATISARGGNTLALLAGDCIIGHALTAAATLHGAAGGIIGRTLVRLCEGQAEEWSTVLDTARRMGSYYSAIEGKTASLFEAACRLGALAAGHGAGATAALGSYGRFLGLGYQLRDDLLDITAEPDAVGKPIGHDITNGVYTYPTLWALGRDPGLATLLRALAHEHESAARAGLAREAADRIRASGATDATRRAIRAQRDQCVAVLAGAADADGLGCHGAELLANLADAVLDPTGDSNMVSGSAGSPVPIPVGE